VVFWHKLTFNEAKGLHLRVKFKIINSCEFFFQNYLNTMSLTVKIWICAAVTLVILFLCDRKMRQRRKEKGQRRKMSQCRNRGLLGVRSFIFNKRLEILETILRLILKSKYYIKKHYIIASYNGIYIKYMSSLL
jgi:hypothetical protein